MNPLQPHRGGFAARSRNTAYSDSDRSESRLLASWCHLALAASLSVCLLAGCQANRPVTGAAAVPATAPVATGQDAPLSADREAARLDALPAVHAAASHHIDHSGRKQQGKASYYGRSFANKKMANGRKLRLHDNVAASRTLPLGTTAKVVNTANGKSATVKVEDRGPYGKGRVIDVSPSVADKLEMKHDGVTSVVVKPITVPQPDGKIKLGAGAADASSAELQRAHRTTQQLTGAGDAEQSAAR